MKPQITFIESSIYLKNSGTCGISNEIETKPNLKKAKTKKKKEKITSEH